ncbi:cytochrome P450 71D9-like [Cornus florida]|uniref:cytochrome P450 71D9-like n=1 Tax=Cornus florida TaxID=4283 RepID=UPI00289A742A|nr:cytochrome P450 71D9-like [Cornus florida]
MEFPILSFPVLFTFLLFLFMVLKTKISSSPKLPPRPWKLPLIGNIHQFVRSLPHHCLRDLAMKYGPLMHQRLGELPIVVITSIEFAKELGMTLASRLMGITGDNFEKFAYWRLLSAKRVQSFRPIREEEASNLIKSISTHNTAGSLINVTEKLFSMTYNIVSKVVVGKKFHGKEEFLSLIRDTMEVAGGFNVADLFPSVKILGLISGQIPRAEKIHQKIDEIFTNIIDEHKARDGEVDCEDLIDVLLKVQG